ncbi:MAG: response regulator, partial [Bacteroides sp.]
AYASRLIQIDGRNKEKVETSYSLMDGLASGRIYCLVDDQNGNTWVGGNSDIMTLRNHKKELYDRYLPGSYNHVCRLQDGRLLWADSDELLFFDPVNLKHRLHKDKLQIADLHINGSSVPLNGNKSGPLVLEAQDNDFRLFFTDLQFESLQRKMLYRLQPDEKEWKMGTMGEGIDYRHLPSGEYTLQVKQVYLDGSEGEVLEIAVKVKKHCWFTYGAFLGYLLVMGLMSWGTYLHVRQRAKRKEVQREREAKLNEIMTVVKMKEIKTQEVENMRNELLTMMVQKLRSPITLIIAPLKELLQEADQMSGRLSDKILVAYRNAIGMLDSCNQLFDIYAQGFPSNELNLSSYSVDALLDSVVHDISELMRVYRIDFRYEKKQNKETAIWVDKKKISIVLHNLLSNALNHTRFSGIIRLTAQETVKDGKRYGMFTVTDNGTEWIKEWKKQANAGDQVDLSSVVFGFSVMQKLVKHHHGSLQIEMEEESGTKAIIYLPLDKGVYDADAHVHFVYVIDSAQENLLKEKAEDRAALVHVLPPLLTEESAPVARGKKKILVVDDHKDIRLYLKVLLGIEYNVVFAINGKEGVSLAKSELPDLILCDVMMPIMDGFECCRLLKEGLDTCHIPLVMLTAKVEDDDIIKGLELGADDYMLKPFTPSILKAKIKNLINGRVYLKQLYTKLLMLPGEDQASVTTDSKEQAGFKEDPFIASVIRIVEENLCEMDFSVKKLAESLSMSQPTLYRKVKQSTDFTIVELIRGVRMRKAAKLLKQKTHTVQEVVEMVGY